MRNFGTLTRALLLAAPLCLTGAALADDPCVLLEARDGTSLNVVDVGLAEGECSVTLPGGATLTSTVDPTADHCLVTKIGNNPIIIWPANAAGGYCEIGNNTIVVWP